MLQALRTKKEKRDYPDFKVEDIIVRKVELQEEVNDEGFLVKKPIVKLVNVTKLVNETKKLIKSDNVNEKLEEIKQMLTKKEK